MAKYLTILLVTLATGFWVVSCSNAPEEPSQMVSQEQETQEAEAPDTERIAITNLKAKLDSGERFLLIDVRRDDELEADGAIEGAIHIPVAELDARMPDIPKDVELVFY